MSFKFGQRVRIKGTDIEGTYNEASYVDRAVGRIKADRFERTLVVPHELLEPVTQPITVTFDPVELPIKVSTWFGKFSVTRSLFGKHFVVNFRDDSNGEAWGGKNIDYADARKLAFAILTVTEAQDA